MIPTVGVPVDFGLIVSLYSQPSRIISTLAEKFLFEELTRVMLIGLLWFTMSLQICSELAPFSFQLRLLGVTEISSGMVIFAVKRIDGRLWASPFCQRKMRFSSVPLNLFNLKIALNEPFSPFENIFLLFTNEAEMHAQAEACLVICTVLPDVLENLKTTEISCWPGFAVTSTTVCSNIRLALAE